MLVILKAAYYHQLRHTLLTLMIYILVLRVSLRSNAPSSGNVGLMRRHGLLHALYGFFDVTEKQETQCTYNLTLRRFRESFLPWKSTNYYLLVCVSVHARTCM
jgi:hypothetical protein